MSKTSIEMLSDLIKQRDDLLAALEEMVASHSFKALGEGATLRRVRAKAAARAAIDRAKGESNE